MKEFEGFPSTDSTGASTELSRMSSPQAGSGYVKPVVEGESCQKFHVKYIVSGKQKVVMDDGTEMELVPGDLAVIQPGHNAWVVGDEPNVLLELAGAVKRAE